MRELEKAAEAGWGAGLIGEGRGREEGLFCKDVLQVEEESCLVQWTCAVFVFTECLREASKKAASAEVYTEFRAQQAFSEALEASVWQLYRRGLFTVKCCVFRSPQDTMGKRKGPLPLDFLLQESSVAFVIAQSLLTYSLVPHSILHHFLNWKDRIIGFVEFPTVRMCLFESLWFYLTYPSVTHYVL